MTNPLLARLAEIVRAVKIISPEAFVFAGQMIPVAPNPAAMPLGAQSQQDPLLAQLTNYLYQYCYSGWFDMSAPAGGAGPPGQQFLQGLSQANTGRDRWDEGWQLEALLSTGQVQLRKAGLLRLAWPGEFWQQQTPGMAPQVGAVVSLFMPRESLVLQPGFYFVFGEAPADHGDDERILRVYWNVRSEGAPLLVSAVTSALNRFQVPFRFKCLADPAHYRRRDAALLFIGRRFYHIVAALLPGVYDQLSTQLDSPVPLFTRELAPGMALAEDPGNMESFGMNRCRILAEGILQAYRQGLTADTARVKAITMHFSAVGIDLERPHLNPGSPGHYDYPPAGDAPL